MVHVQACPRVKVADCPARLPAKFIESLERNQLLQTCCRHPENHDIEALYSTEDERFRDGRENPPDIYILHCTCGRKHRRFMVGSGPRPVWNVN
jgi:hypothetical protein